MTKITGLSRRGCEVGLSMLRGGTVASDRRLSTMQTRARRATRLSRGFSGLRPERSCGGGCLRGTELSRVVVAAVVRQWWC